MAENTTGHELSWDSEIEKEGSDFILLPEGVYKFTVSKFERARHPGSSKLPPCAKAVLTLEIDSPEGKAYVMNNLFLHSKCEGLLTAFFTCIGARRHGERFTMNWDIVPQSTGYAKIGIHEYDKKDGSGKGQSNEVLRFLAPDSDEIDKAIDKQYDCPVSTAPAQNSPWGAWKK